MHNRQPEIQTRDDIAEIQSDRLTPIDVESATHEKFEDISDTKAHFMAEEPWRRDTPFKYLQSGKGKHWEDISNLLEKYDKDLCETWRDEVDKLLIFAGLFSATVTAFLVESYQWLQPDIPTLLLVELVGRIDTASPTSSSLAKITEFNPNPVTILINAFWFLSLSFSLATVVIGILSLQWIREYQRYEELTYQGRIGVRQIRYEGLYQWRIPLILSILPLLLQGALVLFFFGLAGFLWSLSIAVAVPVVISIALVLFFILFTTVAPSWQYFLLSPTTSQSQCAYKSSQSWLFLEFCLFNITMLKKLDRLFIQLRAKIKVIGPISWYIFGSPRVQVTDEESTPAIQPLYYQDLIKSGISGYSNWLQYDTYWIRSRNAETYFDMSKALTWLNYQFKRNLDVIHSIYCCLMDLPAEGVASFVAEAVPELETAVTTFNSQSVYASEGSEIPPESHIKEVLSGLFLNSHLENHPGLEAHILELYIRHVNSVDHTQKLQQYFHPPLTDSLSLEVSFQICMAGERAMSHNILPPTHVEHHLQSMRYLMEALPYHPTTPNDVSKRQQILHQVSCALESCERWLRNRPTTNFETNPTLGRNKIIGTFRGLTYSSEAFVGFILAAPQEPRDHPDVIESAFMMTSLASLVRVVSGFNRQLALGISNYSNWELDQWAMLCYSLRL
ncbi:hypothetical protein M422DRAFT_777197 [Sphaerobolus stellatus SS14]|nr:hypothetical protein M422DRAFT_777197 [Sphaerobolus stellatus SS14]